MTTASQPQQVVFDRPKLEHFKRAYNKAIKIGSEGFIFEGNEYLVEYAEYVIKYLEEKL